MNVTWSGKYYWNADITPAHIIPSDSRLPSIALSVFPMDILIQMAALEDRCFAVLDKHLQINLNCIFQWGKMCLMFLLKIQRLAQ